MMRKNLSATLLVLFLCLYSQNSRAADINAASCSQADVNAAIASASAGDRVLVPAGTCTYTTIKSMTPSVTINKAITVQGQTVCTGRAATLACTDNTVINDGTGTASSEDPIDIISSNARLTGITIIDSRGVSDPKAYINVVSDITGWRVDHVHIKSNIGGTGTGEGVEAKGYGLIDHVYVQNVGTAFPCYGSSTHDSSYPGDYSWKQPMTLGTSSACYIEDSEINNTAAVLNGQDDYAGARFVFRYNDVQGTNIANHGLDSGGLRGGMQSEVYNNTFENSGTHISQWWVARAGTFMIFNNMISPAGGSYDTFLDLRNYRSDCNSGECGTWGNCDGSSIEDQNTTNQQGYICRDQIGRGTESSPSTDWPVNKTNPVFSEQSVQAYSFNNSWKGGTPSIANVNICGFLTCTRTQAFHIINNRDFYVEVASFNGTAGTGSGVLASRPATCTPFVAYWATDTSTLYQCTSTNTWTSYYTPYRYPHPLQGPIPPNGLKTTNVK